MKVFNEIFVGRCLCNLTALHLYNQQLTEIQHSFNSITPTQFSPQQNIFISVICLRKRYDKQLDNYLANINKLMNLISIVLTLAVTTVSINTQQLAQIGQIYEEIGHRKKEDNQSNYVVAVAINQHQSSNHNDIYKQNVVDSQLQEKTVKMNIGKHQQTGSQMNKLDFIKEVAQKAETLTKKNKDKISSENGVEINQLKRQIEAKHQNEKAIRFQQNMQHTNQQQWQLNVKQQIFHMNALLNEPLSVSKQNNLNMQTNFNQYSPNRQLKEQSIIIKNKQHQAQDKKGQTNIQLQKKQNEFINENFDKTKKKHKSYRSNIPRLRRILHIQPDTEDKHNNIIQTYQDLKEKKQNQLKRHINSIDNIRKEQFAHDLNTKKAQDILFYCLLTTLSIFIALPLIKLLVRTSNRQSIKTILPTDEQESTELTQVQTHEASQ